MVNTYRVQTSKQKSLCYSTLIDRIYIHSFLCKAVLQPDLKMLRAQVFFHYGYMKWHTQVDDKLHESKVTCCREHKRTIQNMMTSPNENIFRVIGPLCGKFTGPGEFPTQRPVARSFDVFFDLRLNKRLSKQPWGWWFEMPSWSLWRYFNEMLHVCREI